MSDLINIKDERFWDILFHAACVEGEQARRIEKELEQITVEPARGEWTTGASGMFFVYRCSVCNYATALGKTSFCPHCGADMRGEKNDR